MAFGDRNQRPTTRSCRKDSALVCLLVLFLAVPEAARAAEYKLFLSATTQDGTPVEDIRLDEVFVENAGASCDVKRVQPGSQAIKIALLVDNSDAAGDSLNALRDGLHGFIDSLPAQHEIGLFSIAGQIRLLEDFTTDREALLDRAGGIFVERGSGALFIDGIIETWIRRFSEEDSWPMFVSVLYDGTEASNSTQERELNEFANELQLRDATVHVAIVSTRGGALQTSVSLFLTDTTGGSYEAISAATALSDVLGSLATDIGTHFDQVKNRYRVVFDCGDEIPEQIQAGVSRPDVSVSLFADRRLAP